MTNAYQLTNGIRFYKVTNMEHLASDIRPCYEAMVQQGDNVILSKQNCRGESVAAVYEFIEQPETDGLDLIECRLSLVEVAEQAFAESGGAIAWGLSRI